MLNPRIQDALNDQINAEMYSTNLYLAMAAYFEAQDLPGFAHWMRIQVKEEDSHIHKLFDYVVERGCRVILKEVAAPPRRVGKPACGFRGHLHARAGDHRHGLEPRRSRPRGA